MQHPNITVKWLALMLYIREVLGSKTDSSEALRGIPKFLEALLG
jgi:hypothetical protein